MNQEAKMEEFVLSDIITIIYNTYTNLMSKLITKLLSVEGWEKNNCDLKNQVTTLIISSDRLLPATHTHARIPLK